MKLSLEQLSARMRQGETIPSRQTAQVALALSIPSILEQLVVTAMGYIDAAMVGTSVQKLLLPSASSAPAPGCSTVFWWACTLPSPSRSPSIWGPTGRMMPAAYCGRPCYSM